MDNRMQRNEEIDRKTAVGQKREKKRRLRETTLDGVKIQSDSTTWGEGIEKRNEKTKRRDT